MTRTWEMEHRKDLVWYCFELIAHVNDLFERLVKRAKR